MGIVADITSRTRRLLASPGHEMTRAQRFLRNSIDLARHCARVLQRDQATQMAAALTYRTIFSLVPTVVMSMLVFRAFIGLEEAQKLLETYVYSYLNAASLAADEVTIEGIINNVMANAYKLDVTSVGGIGIILLVWGAIALAVTVEYCFNQIYQSQTGRAWHQRLVIYWTVITLGPVLLFFSLYLAGTLTDWLEANAGPFQGLLQFLTRFSGLLASFLLLLSLYKLMPNAHVQLRAACIGALVAAILFELGKWGFSLYVRKAVPYSALYGSLGLIPLFLLWVYFTWLMVLFGLELTYTLQTLKGMRMHEVQQQREQKLVGDPTWIVPLMTQVGRAFTKGDTISEQGLADSLALPLKSVQRLVVVLEEHDLLHRINNEDHGLSLAQPPDQIALTKLLDIVDNLRHTGDKRAPQAGWAWLNDLGQAEHAHAGEKTLRDLLQ